MIRSARVRLALCLLLAFSISACGGGGGSTPSAPVFTPTPFPSSSATSGPVNEAAYTCPTSDAAASSARGSASEVRRAAAGRRAPQSVPGLLAVSYAQQTLSASRATMTAREQSVGAKLVRELSFQHVGVTTRILSVAPSQADSIAASLRSQAGVKSVTSVGRRYPATVTQPFYPLDPYFDGFTAAQIAQAGVSGAPTFHVQPLVANQTVPGQWGMHKIGLDFAFDYSQSGNTVAANPNALGSSTVKLAIIDTGEDTHHPELSSKIVYQKCFITDPNSSPSTSNFTTDEDGHGTDVSGLAAGATGNSVGFSSAGGNTVIYGYRVYPTPDDNCLSDSTTDSQCFATTADIASAIEDAIAQKVNVISMSLGGGTCSSGKDDDITEGAAIADAIAANIVVVAAAGNGAPSNPAVNAPGCDPGVIAAGATSLADGQPNGAGNSNGNATTPSEYRASYSSYGSPGTVLHSSSAWGIVAPGGDPAGTDTDYLHWIENINTTTPFDANFGGACTADFPGTGALDCRALFAGTSMATPVVAGAAALILAVAPSYQSPTAMKALLCQTADDISDPNEGCGRLNVYRAMAYALNDPTKP